MLCPKKLTNNWNTYKDNYVNNPIAADRLRYDVLYHTDLNRTHGTSNGLDLDRLNWGNYDLVVIDESHNFRNGGKLVENPDEDAKDNRYVTLMKKVIRAGVKTKVLMLSATPVNNRFNDLKNQLALAYEGHTDYIDEKLNTTRSIDEIFRNAQRAFNTWSKWEPCDRTTENLLKMLDFDFFEVLDSVFAEVARLFPSPYIHIGGDECYKGFWEKCSKCKMRMQKEHLKNLEELQSYFVKRVAAMVQKRGKQVIGWDEILEGGLAQETIVMSWRGMKGGIEAAKQGHSVIMTPTDHCYLDFYQGDPTVEPNTYSMLRLQDCYKYQLIPDSVDASLIMGGQGNLWTESVPHYRQVEYMIWPRALAISETLWTDARLRNWKFFVNRVEQQFERFDRSGVNYARSIYDPIIYPHWDKERQLKIAMKTEIEGLSLFYTFDNTIPDIYSNMYTDTLSIPKNASMLRVAAYKGQEQAGRLIDITIDALKKRAAEGEKK